MFHICQLKDIYQYNFAKRAVQIWPPCISIKLPRPTQPLLLINEYCNYLIISPQSERSERRGRSIFLPIVSEWVSNWLLWWQSKGFLWSYIINVSGMGDDVPILGALVTLLTAMGYCCFWWCFYTSVWSVHHISSLYLVWEMTCQFWVQRWYFLRQWYLLNTAILWSGDLFNMAIWLAGYLFILSIWSSGHLVIWSKWSSGECGNLVIWSKWSSSHLVI